MIISNINEDSKHEIINDIDRIKDENPRLTIIKPFYHSENELDLDWKNFLKMSSNDKDICNIKSRLLYKLSNQNMYKKLKKKFIQKNIKKELIPTSLDGTNSNFITESNNIELNLNINDNENNINDLMKIKDEKAKKFMLNNNYQYEMILSNIDNLEKLNRSYFRYQNMSEKDRFESDEESRRIYGKSNEERYYEQLNKLLSLEEPDDDELLSNQNYYDSTNESLINNLSSLKNLLLEETSIDKREFKKYEKKKIKLYKADLMKSIIDKLEIENVTIRSTIPYYFPEERDNLLKSYVTLYPSKLELGISTIPTEKWDLNYNMKFIGLKPMDKKFNIEWKSNIHKNIKILQNESSSDDEKEKARISLLELGWNPILTDSPNDYIKAKNRINEILQIKYPYKFINISEGFIIENFNIDELNKNKGIYIVFLNYYNQEIEKTRIYLSLNSDLDKLYSLDHFMMYNVENFENIKKLYKNNNYKDTYLKVYFLPMEQSLIDKIKYQFDYFNNNYSKFGYNFLSSISNIISYNFQISNYNLFCSYLMNYIITLANLDLSKIDQCFIRSNLLLNTNDNKIITYIVYDGELDEYRPKEIINKLNYFNNSILSESVYDELQTNGINILEYKISPLSDNDYSLLNEFRVNHQNFNEEGLLSAIKKCIDNINKSKNKNNINDMERYSCKLWELRIQLVNQLRFTKNSKMISNLYNTKIGLEDALYNSIQFIKGTKTNYNFRKIFSKYDNHNISFLDKVGSYPDLDKLLNGFNNF